MTALSSNARLIMDQIRLLRNERPSEPITGFDLSNVSGLSTSEVNNAVTELLINREVSVNVASHQEPYDFHTVLPS